MYYCNKCNKLSKPRESANRVVTKIRAKTYYGEDRETGRQVVVGEGYETVQEAIMCKECAAPYYEQANKESV